MKILKFKLNTKITKEELEERIAFAIVSAECTFGKAKVRLNASYVSENNKVAIDVASEVGEHIAELFTGLLIKDFGEDSFAVERVNK